MDIQKIDLKNESGTRIDSVQVEEIDLLSGSINDMLDKISQMELEQEAAHKKLYQASLLKKQAQLQYYRSQINPHFCITRWNVFLQWPAFLAFPVLKASVPPWLIFSVIP